MHDVFISYSSNDRETAMRVCLYLESNGIRCWYAPRNIEPGKEWPSEIVNAIRSSKVFLLISSKNSNISKHVMSEVVQASEANCTIIPFKIDKSLMSDSMSYYLQSLHWLDCSNMSLDHGIVSVHKRVLEVLRLVPPPPPPPPPPKPKSIKKIILAVICALCLVIAGFAYFLVREDKPVSKTNETESTQTDQYDLNPREIDFLNLSELDKGRYPFCDALMLSSDRDLYVVEDNEKGKFYFVKTDTGYIIDSNIEIDISNYYGYVLQTRVDSNYAYFYDYLNDNFQIYNRNKGEWSAKGSFNKEISQNEYIYSFFYQGSEINSNTMQKDDIGLLFFDSEENIISKIIYLTPDGSHKTFDVSSYRLVHAFAGIEDSHEAIALFLDEDYNLKIINIQNGEVLDLSYEEMNQNYFPNLKDYPTVISPDKKYIAYSATKDDKTTKFYVWDLTTGRTVISKVFRKPVTYSFTNKGSILYYTAEDYNLIEYDLKSGHSKILLDKKYFTDNVYFMNNPYCFNYMKDNDIFVFSYKKEFEDSPCYDRLIFTDRSGKVLYMSQFFEIETSDYTNNFFADENRIIYTLTRNDYQNLPEDRSMSTSVYRALFTINEDNLIDFTNQ